MRANNARLFPTCYTFFIRNLHAKVLFCIIVFFFSLSWGKQGRISQKRTEHLPLAVNFWGGGRQKLIFC